MRADKKIPHWMKNTNPIHKKNYKKKKKRI